MMKITTFLILALILTSFTKTAFAFEQKTVTEKGLVAEFYYTKDKNGQRPIIIFGGSSGGNFIENRSLKFGMADLVKQGYAILALSYFDFDGVGQLPTMLKQVPLEYFKTAMDWLIQQPGIHKKGMAIYGTSRGGELSLLLASHYSEIDVVIAAVPSAYVWGVYHRDEAIMMEDARKNPCGSAWTYQGKEIPSICTDAVSSFEPWYTVINSPQYVENAIIPVEKMSAAVLLLSSKYDELWPSQEMSNRIMKRLDHFKYPHVYQHLTYNTGHFLFWDSWNDVLSFLQNYYPVKS